MRVQKGELETQTEGAVLCPCMDGWALIIWLLALVPRAVVFEFVFKIPGRL